MPIECFNLTGEQLAELLTNLDSLPEVYSLMEVFLDNNSDRKNIESWQLGKHAKFDVSDRLELFRNEQSWN